MSDQTSAPSRSQARPLPSLEILDDLLTYDPETGVIRWRKAMRFGRIPAGTVAGRITARGYRQIRVMGRQYYAHRIAFKIHRRREPDGEIDHRDTDKGNNRITNLREASPSGNGCNKKIRPDNTSGVKGIHWDKKQRKWRAQLRVNGKLLSFGCFSAIDDATSAVQTARERLHGEFSCHG